GDIYVSKGQRVRRGARIAAVGISGKSFAPHLHYEVLRDGVTQDPVNYFFASLSPQDYANVAFMSSSTGQTLD
ncbi:MAG: M23 family metallopeptidase, partial [Candidatus Cryptobacteroides sp.]|nr:M23 family metallopeptidase [Candidatus Cryptobacteroides sp.]